MDDLTATVRELLELYEQLERMGLETWFLNEGWEYGHGKLADLMARLKELTDD